MDQNSLKKVKGLLESGMHVVLMPIFKSFADSYIHIYINHYFELEMPFMFGNFEDTPRIPIIEAWLKKAGYIFSRRDPG